MSKRARSSSVEFRLKRHRRYRVEALPHDVVELILERLAVNFLGRLRCVSKKWKSTIDSREFQERHLIRSSKSRDVDVLYVSIMDYTDGGNDYEAGSMRMVLGSSSVIRTVRFPVPTHGVTATSCDGLLCLSHTYRPSFVFNPITGWHRSFPLSGFQKLFVRFWDIGYRDKPCAELGFGKDKITGTYKPVWLYNSSEFGLDNETTCEVFDFATNAWRYVLQASPYRISFLSEPVYLDGSLHWFTQCEETKVLSFDLHTETFQVISNKTPFTHPVRNARDVSMSVLDNRLCVSHKNWPTQVFWSFDDSSRTWEKIVSIDLTQVFSWFGEPDCALEAVAILDKDKLLLHGSSYSEPLVPLVVHHLHTKSFNLLYRPTTIGRCVCYFQSLLTVLSN